MAVLSVTVPVVLLAVELGLSFVVPVRQDAATFTTPSEKGGASDERDEMAGEDAELGSDLGCKTRDTSEVCSSKVTRALSVMDNMRHARKVDLLGRHAQDQVEHFQVSWTIKYHLWLRLFF